MGRRKAFIPPRQRQRHRHRQCRPSLPPRHRTSSQSLSPNSQHPSPPSPPQCSSSQSLSPDFYSVSFYGDVVNVTVAKKAIHVHQWIGNIQKLYCRSVQVLVGLDTEWLPNLAPGDDHPIAIIQLCVGCDCLIFQILHSDFIPGSLHAFLANPRHIFCGVGIEGDVNKLYENHGLRVGRCADLNDLNRMATGGHGKAYRYMGLKKMASAVLGKEMEKPLQVTLSRWNCRNLDIDQVEYAAVDAFVSCQLALSLTSRILISTRHDVTCAVCA